MLSVVVSVPAKLLSLLDAYADGSTSYTLSELARRTGLPLPTAHRLIGELERWGGLERGADGRYRIGLRIVELAALCPRGAGLRDAALPFMQPSAYAQVGGGGTVNVLYAGSLVNLMEHGIGPAFDQSGGGRFQGYAGGSNGLANQIKGQLRRGDVFISANPRSAVGLPIHRLAHKLLGTSIGPSRSPVAPLPADKLEKMRTALRAAGLVVTA